MKKILLCFLLLLFIMGCDRYKKMAIGNDGPIYTIVDDSLWAHIEDHIRPLVEKEIRTPQIERIYYFEPIPLSAFKDNHFAKNLMLITTLDRTDKTSQYVKRTLPDTAIQMINRGETYFFPVPDKLAKRQIFMVLAAPDEEKLIEYLQTRGDEIFQALNQAFINRQFDQIYFKAEEKALTKEIFDQYGFSIRVPHSYMILENNPRERVLQLGRTNPFRWITVYWQDGGLTSVLEERWAVTMRHWLSLNYLDGTYVEKRFLTHRVVNWGNRSVYNIRGLWGHPEKTMGGPFSSFYFYDGVTDRTYFIDVTVWAPGQTKNVYLRQMELIASTFFTNENVLREYIK